MMVKAVAVAAVVPGLRPRDRGGAGGPRCPYESMHGFVVSAACYRPGARRPLDDQPLSDRAGAHRGFSGECLFAEVTRQLDAAGLAGQRRGTLLRQRRWWSGARRQGGRRWTRGRGRAAPPRSDGELDRRKGGRAHFGYKDAPGGSMRGTGLIMAEHRA